MKTKKLKKQNSKEKKKKAPKKNNPRIFVISGPGGAGKTTLIEHLFKQKDIRELFVRGVTVTTRNKRPKEEEGKDYFFIEKDEFLRLEKEKFFLESQKVLDNHYGTPKISYTLAKVQGKDLILCLDVKGGLYLKKTHKAGKIITIFIAAPTKKELYRRMKKRSETKGVMHQRVKLATQELKSSKQYDYLVTNKSIKSASKTLEVILLKDKIK
ncbi:MAG: guanylate kinase [Candidatus Omnitrophica bacterium]|nr:guanylate kinase [Candidatus Omnitrophota bacterium]